MHLKISHISLLSLLLLLPTKMFSQSAPFPIDSIPSSIDEFVQMRDSKANTPEGGAVLTLISLLKMKESEEEGLKFLTVILSQDNVGKGKIYKGFSPSEGIMYHINRLKRQEHNVWEYMPFAYLEGANPDNDYKVSMPYTVTVSRNKYSGDESSGTVKVFINCYGVKPRPITMKRNDKGIWKAKELSSLFVGVQLPKSLLKKDEL
jgi:hypothetical protein